jgi:phosphatidylserine decarboxylase
MTQYDADDTGSMSYTELTAMLDSLGSTLTKKTIEGYFTSCGKDAAKDELTVEEIVLNLERETTKDRSQKAKVPIHDGTTSGSVSPAMAPQPSSEGMGYAGPQGPGSKPLNPQDLAEKIQQSRPRNEDGGAGPNQTSGNIKPISLEKGVHPKTNIPAVKVDRLDPLHTAEAPMPPSRDGSELLTPQSGQSDNELEEDPEAYSSSSSPDDRERVINIRTCPLCHRPRLKKRTEQDIVTHLAICASADWSRVDRIVTANYVTSSQAQRKFFTRIVNKVAIGAYSLGANSANILVQDRRTGQLQEEKMAVGLCSQT